MIHTDPSLTRLKAPRALSGLASPPVEVVVYGEVEWEHRGQRTLQTPPSFPNFQMQNLGLVHIQELPEKALWKENVRSDFYLS